MKEVDCMKTVIIVESPAKTKTIQQYLGSDFIVDASVGHIRELTKQGKGGLGVDVDNGFKATYKVDKKHQTVVKELIKKTKGNKVLLATDPDREGEAIAWHLADVLGLSLEEENRITFNEVTKNAVLEAISHPTKIDMNLVKSQETRRILDRIIGFKLSPLLQKKIKSKSAGRVQSVALKMIVDLEKEIEAFIPTPFYNVKAIFKHFDAEHQLNKSKEIDTEEKLNAILNHIDGPFKVSSVNYRKRSRVAPMPYVTSTLQQDGINRLGYSGAQVMKYAQELYEGIKIGDENVGLITYMRTDSTRLNGQFVTDTLHHIEHTFGKDYVGKVKVKTKENTQDAHEAVRPTSIDRTPESLKHYLSDQQYKVYDLIYRRTLSSLMADALYEEQSIALENHGEVFTYGGSKLVFMGYHKANPDYKEKLDTFLDIEENQLLDAVSIDHELNYTKPKPRYTEASLIKDLEEYGIGRPSTYAETNRTLLARHYIEKKQKALVPTEQGKLTVEQLDLFFSHVINTNYTKKMEKALDEISLGDAQSDAFLGEFYHKFEQLVQHADKEMVKKEPTQVGRDCPLCGAPLVIRKWKKGEFIGCSNYPRCKHTENLT